MALLALLMLLAACGDDDAPAADPATSQACIKVRMTYIETSHQIDEGARLGAEAALVDQKRTELEEYKSAHIECFK